MWVFSSNAWYSASLSFTLFTGVVYKSVAYKKYDEKVTFLHGFVFVLFQFSLG